MKTIGFCALLGTALLTAGCLAQVSSLEPLFGDGDAMALPELAGSWEDAEDASTVLSFRPTGEHEFEFSVADDGNQEPGGLVVRLVRLGNEVYWDLTARPAQDEGLWGEHRLPLHSFARIRLEGDRLEIACLNPRWLKKAAEEGRIEKALERADRMLLVGSTTELQRLILEHGEEAGFLDKPNVFRRRDAE